jgi:hypothetical protein
VWLAVFAVDGSELEQVTILEALVKVAAYAL